MFLKILSLVQITVGLGIMIRTTYRHQKLGALIRQEVYHASRGSFALQRLFTALLYLFLFGFCVGFIDMLSRDVEPIYNFVVMIFFFGSIFIALGTESQISMANLLRRKNIEIIKTFVNAVDLKDPYTKGHSEHVYGITALFFERLPDDLRQQLNRPKLLDAALLHDCGKISIDDDVLHKPGRLNGGDWDIMRTHPANGKRMLDDTCFYEISDWVLYHHERMDGQGYYRLPGSSIPLESRIISIADTYSALCMDRVYRPRVAHEQAIAIMQEAAGSQLDPELLSYFRLIPKEELEALVDATPLSGLSNYNNSPVHAVMLAADQNLEAGSGPH